MLTVLHVMARLPASGTERQLVGMLDAAHGRHWDARLCVLFPDQPLVPEVRALGVPVVELSGPAGSPARARVLRRLAGDVDVLHSSLWGANAYARGVVARRRRPAVVVSERRVEDFRGPGRRRLDRLLRSRTDAWIGNSGDVRDFIVRAHGAPAEAVTVIRNGMDTSVFRPDGPAAARREGVLRIGAVGRLVHQKGFDVLLDAVPRLVAGHDGEVEVVIVGEGPDHAALQARAAGLPVTLPGALATPADVAAFLRSLDVFVMPSRYEGLPNALLEAAACGVPVVATEVPGSTEAAEAVARFVPVEQPGALADALLATAKQPPDRTTCPVDDFDQVARGHLAVFEAAHAARHARRPGAHSPAHRGASQGAAR